MYGGSDFSADDTDRNSSRLIGNLYKGTVSQEKFNLLIDISNIYSERIVRALELYLVRGLDRTQACEVAGISKSCFSVKLRRIQDVSRTVVRLYRWYSSPGLEMVKVREGHHG
ncbi:TPA: transcriptional regulator [Citrobacter werkmanii]|nr:transcriptional regulator [Citrobacter werkmanii]